MMADKESLFGSPTNKISANLAQPCYSSKHYCSSGLWPL